MRASRAGSLDPDEDSRPRYYNQPPQKQGRDWVPGIAGAVIAVVISAAMMFLLNPNKTAIANLSAQLTDSQNQVTALSAQISEANSRIDNLTNTEADFVKQDALVGLATESSVTDLSNQVVSLTNGLQTEIAAISANVTALQHPTSSSGSGDEGIPLGVATWTFRNPPSLVGYAVGDNITYSDDPLSLRVERVKIREAGSYEFFLEIANRDDTLPSNPDSARIQLVMTPNADALLDESTSIFTDDMPEDEEWFNVDWIDWEDGDFTQVSKGDEEITRRVTFESEDFSIPSLEAGDSAEISLVLELVYAIPDEE